MTSRVREGGVLERLAGQSLLYSAGNTGVKLAGLLLAPVLLNPTYLPVRDYGLLAIALVSGRLLVLVCGLGISTGLLRFSTDPKYAGRTNALPFTALVATAGLAAFVTALIHAGASGLSGLLLGEGGRPDLVRLLGYYVGAKLIASVPLAVLRFRERAGLYAAAMLLETVLLLAAVLALAVGSRLGLEGVLLAYVVSAVAATGVLVLYQIATSAIALDASLVAPLVRYGTPLVMGSLASWFLQAGDRYLLNWLATTETVALYDWASRIGGLVNVIFVQSFQLAFLVVGLKQFDAGSTGTHRSTLYHYGFWTGWVVLAVGLLSLDGMNMISSVAGVDRFYADVDLLVYPVAAGFWGYGAYHILSNVLYATGRTRTIASVVVAAAVVNLLTNLLLIPVWGAPGAAAATLFAYLLMAGISAIVAERHHRVGYDWRAFWTVFGVMTVVWWAGVSSAEWAPLQRIWFRLALLAAYAPATMLLGAYSLPDMRSAVRISRSMLRRSAFEQGSGASTEASTDSAG